MQQINHNTSLNNRMHRLQKLTNPTQQHKIPETLNKSLGNNKTALNNTIKYLKAINQHDKQKLGSVSPFGSGRI